jgi:carbon-monoxide dehydrogenase small subunit/xanthine dehydrogenase small subunit
MKVAFTVNGVPREVDAPPVRRLLDILRDDLGLTGAKEGCGEGECGACAVLLDGMLVQSCLIPAVQLAGRRVVTIEALGSEAAPDPVQQAFLDEGAVQCGFCIPGMVLATRALLARNPEPDDEAIRAGLSGNICRCTGYERIVRAVQRAAELGTPGGTGTDGAIATNLVHGERPGLATTPVLPVREAATQTNTAPRPTAKEPVVHSPTTLEAALAVLQSHATDGTILAGGTDLMLPGAQASLAPGFILDLSRVESLVGVRLHGDTIELGPATTVATLADDPTVERYLPALAAAARLFGAPAIRNRATLGGNLASASPAADLPPPLLALGATVVLASATGKREVPLEAFVTGYRQTVRRPTELIVAVRVPLPAPGTRQAFFKAGTRRAQSIARASVAGAARVDAAGTLRSVRLAAGSVAPMPVLLIETMRLLEGRSLGAELIKEAEQRAAAEITPIEDVRSNVEYRRFVTGRLVAKFLRGCASP